MDELHFTWDENKNVINQRKHGISFEEARGVFGDEISARKATKNEKRIYQGGWELL